MHLPKRPDSSFPIKLLLALKVFKIFCKRIILQIMTEIAKIFRVSNEREYYMSLAII